MSRSYLESRPRKPFLNWMSLPLPPWPGGWLKKYLYSRVASVYGGTLDIQRNIVAERIYWLPRA